MMPYASVERTIILMVIMMGLMSVLLDSVQACGPAPLTRVEKKTTTLAVIPNDFKSHPKADGTPATDNAQRSLVDNISLNTVGCTINVSPEQQINGRCVSNLVPGMPGLCQSPDGQYINLHPPCNTNKVPVKKRLRRASQQHR